MWFLLRMTFWLGLVLVLLPSFGSQPAPKSEVGVSEALSATKGAVTDLQNFCERQKETCAVGLQAAITIGQRAQAGAKMLYELLSKKFGSDESKAVQREIVPPPSAGPQQHLSPADRSPH